MKKARIERGGAYVKRDEFIITIDGIAEAGDVGLRRRSTVSFASGYVKSFKVGITNSVCHLCTGWLRNMVDMFLIRSCC